jgi:hypothetical protein
LDIKDKSKVKGLNLETVVVSTHLTQPIDSPSIMVKTLITNKLKFHRFEKANALQQLS